MSQATAKPFNRSSLVFLAGLTLAAGIAVGVDGWGRFMLASNTAELTYDGARPVLTAQELSEDDLEAAKIAWRYFEQNFRPETGMVDSVAGFPSGTLWDQGSYLFALLSAQGLGLIDKGTLDYRVGRLLDGMSRLPLFNDLLPNKVYNSETLEMVDYKNNVSEDGVGWSALDIARMLMALRVLEHRNPEYGPQIRGILSKWTLPAMAYQGVLQGAGVEGGEVEQRQEGRIGYEQYGARAAAMWGLDTLKAANAQPIMEWQTISGVEVPVDLRTASAFRAITPTLSEPFFMQGLELGFDSETGLLASRVYEAQEQRYERTGQMTMVSEDNINQAPYFLYSSVYSNAEPWAVVTEDGEKHPELRTVSLKAAFAWDALYGTDYTDMVRTSLKDLETERGWAAGRYEATGEINDVVTLNTNAVVLEAMHYIAKGPLWSLY